MWSEIGCLVACGTVHTWLIIKLSPSENGALWLTLNHQGKMMHLYFSYFVFVYLDQHQAVKVSPGGSLPSPLAPWCRIRQHCMMPYTAPPYDAVYGTACWRHIQCSTLEPHMVQHFGAIYGAVCWCRIRHSTLEPYTVQHFGAVYGAALWSRIWCSTLEQYTLQHFGAIYAAAHGAIYGTALWSRIRCSTSEPYTAQHFGATYGAALWSHIRCSTLEPYTVQHFGARGQGREPGSEGARQGARGWGREQGMRQGARGWGRERGGGEGNETHVILGFRVTTCDRKKFDDIIDWLGVPTTGERGGKWGGKAGS